MPIRVSIIEDDRPYRDALGTILKGTPGLACSGAYANAEDALASLHQESADIFLVDINLPGISGIEFVGRLKERIPEALVLMLTVFDDTDKLFASLRAGANGYVLKSTAPAGILDAITEVFSGGAPMSRGVGRKVLGYFHTLTGPPGELQALTQREQTILQQLVTGRTVKEMADALGVAHETVRTHLRSIYRKLHVHSRTEAVVKSLRSR